MISKVAHKKSPGYDPFLSDLPPTYAHAVCMISNTSKPFQVSVAAFISRCINVSFFLFHGQHT